jgi:hypothetical protein
VFRKSSRLCVATSSGGRGTTLAKPTTAEVLALIGRLENFVNSEEYYPARNSYRGVGILALVSKALTVARAVCSLIDSGFPGEAFGLSRTLLDICFTVRYISNKDTEARAKLFAEFYAKDHEGWGKIIQKFYPTAPVEDTEAHREALEKAKNYKNAHQWTGMGDQTRQMACEPDSYEFDSAGNGINCEWDYEVIYKWTSFYVHSTVSALESHITEPREPFRIRDRPDIDKGRGEDALVNVLGYVSRSFVHAYRAIKHDPPDEILLDVNKAIVAFSP